MATPLEKLRERGQSVWLDFISRDLITSGGLERLIREACVTGLTSNPTIFEKAVAHGTDYDDLIRELVASGTADPNDVFLELSIRDIQDAADRLRPVFDRTGGRDGFVSLEVPPSLAHNAETTTSTVAMLWRRVDRPNLMVKIPATSEGIPAIEDSIAAGINVNITLIFSLQSYRNVINAYLAGLGRRQRRGENLDIHSVASFFVSRVDTAVDALLEERLSADPGNRELEELRGQAAIANAVAAYELFDQTFNHGEEFAGLRSAGALCQRPLWASTSAKNPAYRDVVYAEALIGPDTVDTMPPATIEAFQDHGIVEGDTVNRDYAGAHRVLEALEGAGIDMEAVTRDLLEAGVDSFGASYDALLRAIAEKIDTLHGGFGRRQRLDLGSETGAAAEALGRRQTERVAARIWSRDPSLWTSSAEHAAVIGNRLGWLDVVASMRAEVPRLTALAAEFRDAGITDAVLLGMGGSSLCAEVLRTSFEPAEGHPRLHVLDTTDPVAVANLSRGLELPATLFIVASKSGTTLETRCHLEHFWAGATAADGGDPGRRFIAITDPGSPLEDLARQRSFRAVFENPPDIGGRYSALSYFGLVPAAIAGIDVGRLLERAGGMRIQCLPGMPADLNCGLRLGSALATLAAAGRDKVTILAPETVGAFGLWAEQLIAESTGKQGRGLIPVAGEPAGDPDVYADDRVFVVLRAGGGDPELDGRAEQLQSAGQPVITLELQDAHDLAAEFFRWEFATAVAGAAMGIDPFDEPNVQESKDNTRRMLDAYERDGELPAADGAASDGEVEAFLGGVRPGDYVALMAYVTPGPAVEAALTSLRTALRDRYRVATTVGLGPRFLHSTGQLHKGGPDSGLYLQITADDAEDVEIPGRPFGFSVLKRAQAQGDLESLAAHGRRVLRVHCGADAPAVIRRLATLAAQPSGAGV